MRSMVRSTISKFPAPASCACLALLLASSASAQQQPTAAEALPAAPPAPLVSDADKRARPKPKLKPKTKLELEAAAAEADPNVEQAKRAAEADAKAAAGETPARRARPRPKSAADPDVEEARLAAQADAQAAAAGGDGTKAAKPGEPEKTRRVASRAKVATEVASGAVEAEPILGVTPAAASTAPKTKAKARAKVAAKPKRERQPTEAYRKLRDSWHAPLDAVATLEHPGRIPLVLSAVNTGITVTMTPQREDGGFSAEDLQRAASAFAPRDMKSVHPVASRLLDLVYRAMRHFKAPLVHVVSGYRKDRAGSRHTQGRAIDMVLPGVSNDELAAYVRTYGFCGVGIYPKSGFVHLDVRDRSYFWVDNSMPGERSRSNPILPDEAIQADRLASARGEAPDTFVPDNDAEDRAAARSYARRAKLRRDRALREAARAQEARRGPLKPKPTADASGARKPAAGTQQAGVF